MNNIPKTPLFKYKVNGRLVIDDISLMEYFNCASKDTFIEKFVEPTRNLLTEWGEEYENHIICVEPLGTLFPDQKFIFSERACFLMGYAHMNSDDPDLNKAASKLYTDYGDAKYKDTAFFHDSADRKTLRIGDKVELLNDNVENVFMARYAGVGVNGRITAILDNGNLHILTMRGGTVEMKPENVKRIVRERMFF